MTPEQLKASILQWAMEGKLVKQDPNDEPASVLLEKIKAEKKKLIKEGKIKRSKKLPPVKDDEKPFNIPASWEWVRLGNLIHIFSGKNLPRRKMINKGIPVYGGNGITGYHDKFNVNKFTIVIGRVGFYCGSVHITRSKAWVTDNAFIVQYPQINIDRNFLVFALKFMDLGQNTSATAQPVISGKKIYPLPFPLPPLSEQHRIVAKIEKLMPLVDKYAEAYNRLKTIDDNFDDKLKQSILQYAMEGKLVKQDPNDEPASVLFKKIKAEKEKLIEEGKIKKSKKLPSVSDDEKPFNIPASWEWVRLPLQLMMVFISNQNMFKRE